jgi:hypothetical protein
MHVPEAQADFRRMIREVVEIEGPIRDELVLRRVREGWGSGELGIEFEKRSRGRSLLWHDEGTSRKSTASSSRSAKAS